MQPDFTSARVPSRRRSPRLQGLLALALLASGCAGTGATERPRQVVVSSAWEGSEEERPLGRTLAVWEDLSSVAERPSGLDVAAEAISEGDVDGAFQALELAMEQSPENPLFVAARGHLELSLGYLRAAEADFERAIELDPENPNHWSALGRVRLELGLFTRASRALEQAIALGRCDAQHQVLLARAYRGCGRDEDAIRAYFEALRRARETAGVGLLAEVVGLQSSAPGEVLPIDVFGRPFSLLAATLALDPLYEEPPLDPACIAVWNDLSRLLARR